MTSVIKNGQPSMEEILASIRRIVADDPGVPAPLINLNGALLERSGNGQGNEARVDESADFELPSMFRPGQDASQRRAKAEALKHNGKSAPIGRLTDAIRNVAPKVAPSGHNDPARQTQAIVAPDAQFGIRPKANQSLSSLSSNTPSAKPMAPQAEADMHSPSQPCQAASVNPQHNGNGFHATSSQPGSQPEATSNAVPAVAEPTPNATPPVAAAAPPRVMAPFRDTRMNTMSSGGTPAPKVQASSQDQPHTAAPSTGPVPQNPVSAAGAQIGSIVPGALDLPGRETAAAVLVHNGADVSSPPDELGVNVSAEQPQAAQATMSEHPVVSANQAEANPPPIPEEGEDVVGHPKIEDATADLLRPMLRQWLSDNMPRMVEKALHIEVAQSVRPDKPDGSS